MALIKLTVSRPSVPVDNACITVTIKGCPKTFHTHSVGLQRWYSSNVMLRTQFVFSLNQFFIRCTAWLQPLSGCSQGLLRKSEYRLSRLCASCLNVVVTSFGVDSKKLTINLSLNEQSPKINFTRFILYFLVLPQGGGGCTCYFVNNFYRSPWMCP
jgi:hypothetical protein